MEEEPSGNNDIVSTLGNTSIRDTGESEDEEPTEQILKLVIVGDGTTGKTSICTRFAQKNFNKKYSQTIGVDFFSRRILLPHNVPVLLQIWDIGGQSLAANMLSNYLFGAHAVLFVYDVMNMATFENLTDWIETVRRITKNYEKPPFLALIGNKTDMEHRRSVRIDKHNKFAEKSGMSSYYTSAKTGDSVDLCFKQIAAVVLGIQLSKVDIESEITVVRAPVTVCEPEEQPPKLSAIEVKQPHSVKESLPIATNTKRLDNSNKHSSVCSIQ
uniref:Ras-related protein Rab-28 n=1 Tax=Panagrolaimus sp. JU765 TaxID=591449 RepID=A0AC34PUD7_9BILA